MQRLKGLLTALFILSLVGGGVYAAYNRGFLSSGSVAAASSEETSSGSFLNKIIPSSIKDKVLGTTTQAQDQINKIKKASDNNPQVQSLSKSASSQLGTLTEKSSEVTQHIEKVVEVNEKDEEKSVSDKTLEYGQYLYCKQVVETYEAAN